MEEIDIFSGILGIVMGAFPLACFLLFLEILLTNQIGPFLEVMLIAADIFLCSLFLLAVYAIRLKAKGIRVREFARKLWPLVKENFKIGSVIDAAPYNVRYCVENFGFKLFCGGLQNIINVISSMVAAAESASKEELKS